MTISAPCHSLRWGCMGTFSDRGSLSTLKMKTHSSKCFPLCASKWLLNESNLIITFIINSVRIRWDSVAFVFDLRVCQVLMRVLGSVWWLFYPQPYVYMKLCHQTELRNLEEVFDFFFFKEEILENLCFIAISLQPVSGQSLSDKIYWQQTVLLLMSAWGNGLLGVSTISWCKMR